MLIPCRSSVAKYSGMRAAGTGVPPSPPIAVVTPCRTLFSASPLRGRTPPDWSIMSIQPGDTYFPRASISVRPRPSTLPIRTNRPSRMATSARIQGFPAPSSTRPFRITTSYAVSVARDTTGVGAAPVDVLGDEAAAAHAAVDATRSIMMARLAFVSRSSMLLCLNSKNLGRIFPLGAKRRTQIAQIAQISQRKTLEGHNPLSGVFALLCGHLSYLRNLRSPLGAEMNFPRRMRNLFAVPRRDEASKAQNVSFRTRGRSGLARPDPLQHASKVPSQDAADLCVGVLPPDQPLGEVEHALRVVEPLDVDLLAKAVAPLVARAQLLVHLRRQVVVAVEVDVAADAEVLGTDQLLHVIEVVEDILEIGRAHV